MRMPETRSTAENGQRRGELPWAWLIAAGCISIILLGILAPRQIFTGAQRGSEYGSLAMDLAESAASSVPPKSMPALTPEQIVASRVERFAQDRLRIARAMAKRLKIDLPADLDRFFKAVAAGRWDELNECFRSLKERRDSGNGDDLRKIWGPILETLLIAECARSWPAQELLDYGQATIGSLPKGMVYIGGTDPGRGIPTLLNETSEGDRHIVITQNGLADGTYLDYLRFLYGDQMALPSAEETSKAFSDYINDAQKRLQHDRLFPDEPKQVQPGEDIRLVESSSPDAAPRTDGTVQVSGNVAVMAINERILQALTDKNPGMSFGLEESFPLRSTYSSAVPLGPIMQLRATDAQDSFTVDTASRTLNYWRNTTEELASDPDAPQGSDVRKTYSHMAWSQANLLADHSYTAEAEQTYRLAMEMEPSNAEAVYSLANLLAQTGRSDQAHQLLDTFTRNYPAQSPLPVPTILFHPPK